MSNEIPEPVVLELSQQTEHVGFQRTRSSSCEPVQRKPPQVIRHDDKSSRFQWSTKSKSMGNVNFPPSSHFEYQPDFPPNDRVAHTLDIMKPERRWERVEHQLHLLKLKTKQINFNYGTDFGHLLRDAVSFFRAVALPPDQNFKMLDDQEIAPKIRVALPIIIDMALNLPNLLTQPIPLLESGDNATISISRKLCASILANAFLGTVPEEKRKCRSGQSFPNFNFLGLFHIPHHIDPGNYSNKKEKLKCLLNYFCQRYGNLTDDLEKISFHRKYNTERLEWRNLEQKLCNVKVDISGLIEDADGMLQVDFANRMIGGGVLNNGCVQEEIRFATWPELIVARLFVESLTDVEVLVMTGAKRYSEYAGYAKAFKYLGPLRNVSRNGGTDTQIVAMDAIYFRREYAEKQHEKTYVERELHKAFVGFSRNKPDGDETAVATGNWGCGAFNGDPQLKFLLQWMAASVNDRPSMVYYTFGNETQAEGIHKIVRLFKKKEVAVGQLYKLLLEYETSTRKGRHQSVFKFLIKTLSEKRTGPNNEIETGSHWLAGLCSLM